MELIIKKTKKLLKSIWYYICLPYNKIKIEIFYRKELKEFHEQDPFNYE